MLTLADGLEEENGGRNGNVERIANAEHGYLDVSVCSQTPLVSQSGSLGTHDDGSGLAHIGVVVVVGVLQLSGEYADALSLEPADTRF